MLTKEQTILSTPDPGEWVEYVSCGSFMPQRDSIRINKTGEIVSTELEINDTESRIYTITKQYTVTSERAMTIIETISSLDLYKYKGEYTDTGVDDGGTQIILWQLNGQNGKIVFGAVDEEYREFRFLVKTRELLVPLMNEARRNGRIIGRARA